MMCQYCTIPSDSITSTPLFLQRYSRDLRSFEIRFEFESDGPIRKFRIAAPTTFAVVQL